MSKLLPAMPLRNALPILYVRYAWILVHDGVCRFTGTSSIVSLRSNMQFQESHAITPRAFPLTKASGLHPNQHTS